MSVINPASVPSGYAVFLFNKNGSERKRLPLGRVGVATFSYDARGGYNDFSVPVAGDSLADPVIANVRHGDRVEIYHSGRRLYRGYITTPSKTLREPVSYGFGGYGLSQQLSRVICDKRYAFAPDTDAAEAFRQVCYDALRPDFPNLVIDVEQTGYVIESLDATQKSLGDAINDIIKLTGELCVWGCDVVGDRSGDYKDALNPDLEKDRLYLRVVKARTEAPDFVAALPSRFVSESSTNEKSAELCNVATVIGGTPKYPNRITNASFEYPAYYGEELPNLLVNPSFSPRAVWSLGNGASYKAAGNQEGAAYDGQDMVELDAANEEVYQARDGVFNPLSSPKLLLVGCYARRESGGVAATAHLRFWTRTDGTANEEIPPESGNTPFDFSIAPATGAWERFEFLVGANYPISGYDGFQYLITCLTGGTSHGILIDSCFVTDLSNRTQSGWTCEPIGTGIVQGYYPTEPRAYDGGYCVEIRAAASDANNCIRLRQLKRGSIPVSTGEELRFGLFARRGSDDTEPEAFMRVQFYDDKGTPLNYAVTDYNQNRAYGINAIVRYDNQFWKKILNPLPQLTTPSVGLGINLYPPGSHASGLPVWELLGGSGFDAASSTPILTVSGSGTTLEYAQTFTTLTVPEKAVSADLSVDILNNSTLVIDATYCIDSVVPMSTPYYRDGPIMFKIRAKDVCEPDTPAQKSEENYGAWEDTIASESITDYPLALRAAIATFLIRAVPLVYPSLTLTERGELDLFPGKLLGFAGSEGPSISAIPAAIKRVSFTVGDLLTRIVECENPEKKIEQIVKDIAERFAKSTGGGGFGVAAFNPGSTNVGGSGGGTGGDNAEVVNARERVATGRFTGFTYASLKSMINALWLALGVATADPTEAEPGQVLAVNAGGDGVEFIDAGAAGSVPTATATVTGTVRTDINQADPQVVTVTTYAAFVSAIEARTITGTGGLTGGGSLAASRTLSIVDGGVSTAKLADSAVTSAKIADATIVAGDLADGAVTTAKLAATAVTTAKLADASVTAAKVSAAGIADGKVLKASGGVATWGDDSTGSGGSGGTQYFYAELCKNESPSGSGGLGIGIFPLSTTGAFVWYIPTTMYIYVVTPPSGGSFAVQFQWYSGTSDFSGSVAVSAAVASGNHVISGAQPTDFFPIAFPKSGDKYRASVNSLNGAAGITIIQMFQVSATDPAL